MDGMWEPQTDSFGNSGPAIQQLCEQNKYTGDQKPTCRLLETLKNTKFNSLDSWKDDKKFEGHYVKVSSDASSMSSECNCKHEIIQVTLVSCYCCFNRH